MNLGELKIYIVKFFVLNFWMMLVNNYGELYMFEVGLGNSFG